MLPANIHNKKIKEVETKETYFSVHDIGVANRAESLGNRIGIGRPLDLHPTMLNK
jgi:hypothetical protein